MTETFTMCSLFDGSGTFPLAAQMNGIKPVYASEVEPYPIAVTRSRFPEMEHLGSVTGVKGDAIKPVDVITFGSPCQDLSISGTRAGIHDGTRSNLFFEAIRIIKEMRDATNGEYPKYAVWENVRGALSSQKGRDFQAVIQSFTDLCQPGTAIPFSDNGWKHAGLVMGDNQNWSLAWRLFDAQHWGVAQRRKRIFVICSFVNGHAGELLFDHLSDGVTRNFSEAPDPIKETKLYQVLQHDAPERYNLSIKACMGIMKRAERKGRRLPTMLREALQEMVDKNAGTEPNSCKKFVTLEHHPHDSRLCIPKDQDHMQTLNNRMGTGGNNVPLLMEVAEEPCVIAVGNGQLHSMHMSEVANTLDCMHDQQIILIRN